MWINNNNKTYCLYTYLHIRFIFCSCFVILLQKSIINNDCVHIIFINNFACQRWWIYTFWIYNYALDIYVYIQFLNNKYDVFLPTLIDVNQTPAVQWFILSSCWAITDLKNKIHSNLLMWSPLLNSHMY
jgi:predicted permease